MTAANSSATTFKMTLRTKMFLLSLAAFIGIICVAVTSILLMNDVRIGSSTYQAISGNKDALEKIALLKSDIFQINSELQQFMLETDTEIADKGKSTIKDLSRDIDDKFQNVLNTIGSKDKKDTIVKSQAIWKEYRKTLIDEILPAVNRGDVLKASYLLTGIQQQRFNSFSRTVSATVESIRKDVSDKEGDITSRMKSKVFTTIFVTMVIIAILAVFSFVITESVTRPMKQCVSFAKTVANGKLDERLSVTAGGEVGELAEAMNTMASNLQSMVSRVNSASEALNTIGNNIDKVSQQVVASSRLQEKAVDESRSSSEQISLSATQIAGGVDALSASTSETSSSILQMAANIEEIALGADRLSNTVDEVSDSIMRMAASVKDIGESIVNLLSASTTTASSIAEMDATIKQVEKNAMDTSAITESVRSDAESGMHSVEEAIIGMQEIRKSSQITSEVIENLSHRAKDIGAILSVIDEVAEQTNLLALNAAIIAAQAGEHGKGFAVVADEIKELAERTSSSTREIASVIKGVQDETRRAVDAINLADASISEGERLSHRSGKALEKIVGGIQRASIQVREIARATVEQAKGSQSIKEAMESIEDMVGHIANSAYEQTKGSDTIASAVERMKELTRHVKISTHEQSNASSHIAQATEDISSRTIHIRDACHSQLKCSDTISLAMSHLQKASINNSESSKVLGVSVSGLSRQIELLEKEMAGFKI